LLEDVVIVSFGGKIGSASSRDLVHKQTFFGASASFVAAVCSSVDSSTIAEDVSLIAVLFSLFLAYSDTQGVFKISAAPPAVPFATRKRNQSGSVSLPLLKCERWEVRKRQV